MTTTIRVLANTRWNATNVIVRPGETWSFSTSGHWVDWFVRCGPEGYTTHWLVRYEERRRVKTAKWFCLMGALDRNEAEAFEIGRALTKRFDRGGQLEVFANDLDGAYWNNWGAVWLTCAKLGSS